MRHEEPLLVYPSEDIRLWDAITDAHPSDSISKLSKVKLIQYTRSRGVRARDFTRYLSFFIDRYFTPHPTH